MLIYFRSGRVAWFHAAQNYEIDGGELILYGKRHHQIVCVPLNVVEFYVYDNEDLTTYGYPESADPAKENACAP